MRIRIYLCATLLLGLGAASARAQGEPCGAPQTNFQDSVEDLKRLLTDIVTTQKEKGKKTAWAMAEALLIPDPESCFRALFGPQEGGRLAGMYSKIRGFREDPFPRGMEQAAKEKKPTVGAEKVDGGTEAKLTKLEAAVLRAMQSPVTLYSANFTATNRTTVWALGYYIYAGGGFRSVDSMVFHALSGAPPMRIIVGGNVQQARLLRKPTPRYPEEARAARIQGTVRLQVVIGTDGTIKELEVKSGPAELVDSAVAAVRQWRYQPTLLNGLPVEVSSTIDVLYALER